MVLRCKGRSVLSPGLSFCPWSVSEKRRIPEAHFPRILALGSSVNKGKNSTYASCACPLIVGMILAFEHSGVDEPRPTEGEVALMQRILLRLSVTVVMLVVLLALAVPAFAAKPTNWCSSYWGCGYATVQACKDVNENAPVRATCKPNK